jgi:GxxExxY protein
MLHVVCILNLAKLTKNLLRFRTSAFPRLTKFFMSLEKLTDHHLTDKVIGCAIAVHKALGPGLLEKFYEEALCIELDHNDIPYERQYQVGLSYRGKHVGHHRLDLIIFDTLIVELKAIKKLEDIHFATTLSYLRISRARVALLLNFNAPKLSIRRFANTLFKLNAEALKGGNAEDLIEYLRHNESEKNMVND